MRPRMPSPAMIVPGAFEALQGLTKAAWQSNLPESVINLVALRASQINGCSLCTQAHAREARATGETEDRLAAVATWRDAPHFTEAERAALALAEAVTRISDRPDPVSDDVWARAAKHYDAPQLSALLLNLAIINVWNRLNVATRQVAGSPGYG